MEAGRIFFWIVALVALTSSLYVVTAQNVVRAAIALALTLFTVAIVYVSLAAEFLAVVQVLVYIGGVIVMILFTVMFTRRSGENSFLTPSKGPLSMGLAAVFAGGLFFILYRQLTTAKFAVSDQLQYTNTFGYIGDALLTSHVIPFEVVSILLLMALVGAVILIKKEVKPEEEDA
ncbi:MAG: NADH-quinone oxidoreductase subunit J [Chrysiogenetes bacterium]|nr:NADH-quinone oxidoreductase subunit J [Chrysiogenetes bacterium]